MTDFGYMTVTATCPVLGCGGTDEVRVHGSDGNDVYRIVTCSTCSAEYTVKVAVTVEGSVTSYEHD